jgi:hypothetical protein
MVKIAVEPYGSAETEKGTCGGSGKLQIPVLFPSQNNTWEGSYTIRNFSAFSTIIGVLLPY